MTTHIRLEKVSVDFQHNKETISAVKELSLEIKRGEVFGIIGLSGAGKSTLVRTLNLLQVPSAGQIFIDEQEITHAKGAELRALRQKTGMIFQHFNLITNRTVAQNLAFALKAADYPKAERAARITELLQLVDLRDKAQAYPSQLSGGQKQRVGIARALASNPEILLCDEATSALDAETTEEIVKILKRIQHELKLTIVFITHELGLAQRLFDRVAVMENGRLVEQASTYTLFARPQAALTKRLIARQFDLQLPTEVRQNFAQQWLLELHYLGKESLDPVISKLSQEFAVDISILHGKIEYIQQQAIGVLVIGITGADAIIPKVLDALRQQVDQLIILQEAGGRNHG